MPFLAAVPFATEVWAGWTSVRCVAGISPLGEVVSSAKSDFGGQAGLLLFSSTVVVQVPVPIWTTGPAANVTGLVFECTPPPSKTAASKGAAPHRFMLTPPGRAF